MLEITKSDCFVTQIERLQNFFLEEVLRDVMNEINTDTILAGKFVLEAAIAKIDQIFAGVIDRCCTGDTADIHIASVRIRVEPVRRSATGDPFKFFLVKVFFIDSKGKCHEKNTKWYAKYLGWDARLIQKVLIRRDLPTVASGDPRSTSSDGRDLIPWTDFRATIRSLLSVGFVTGEDFIQRMVSGERINIGTVSGIGAETYLHNCLRAGRVDWLRKIFPETSDLKHGVVDRDGQKIRLCLETSDLDYGEPVVSPAICISLTPTAEYDLATESVQEPWSGIIPLSRALHTILCLRLPE